MFFQIFLEFFSKGAEHGHTHQSTNNKFPWILIASLSIHAFVEGMPLSNQPELLIGIIVHKIPIGMVITLLLWEVKTPITQKLVALSVFALMTPLGNFVWNTALNFESITIIIDAIVVGILLHISTTILFESSEGHVFNVQKFVAILAGIFFAAIFVKYFFSKYYISTAIYIFFNNHLKQYTMEENRLLSIFKS